MPYEGYQAWDDHNEISGDRRAIYRDLHRNHLNADDAQNLATAQRVLELLFRYIQPRSVLDVGCGVGIWLMAARALGAEQIFGIEGPWLDPGLLRIDPAQVAISDLEKPFDTGRRFDLAMSLEVAEHLADTAADGFVAALVRHSDVVLFSAAVPHQGGHHHVNEQWPGYWIERFQAHGYGVIDFLRWELWDDNNVYWHIRQNLLLFVNRRLADDRRYRALWELHKATPPPDVVHPEAYLGLFRLLHQLQEIQQQHEQLVNYLAKGGTFRTGMKDGQLNLQRLKRRTDAPGQPGQKENR